MKKDIYGTIYIQEQDLSTIKDLALQKYKFFGARDSSGLLAKSYIGAVIEFLVSNNIIENVDYKFGEISDPVDSVE